MQGNKRKKRCNHTLKGLVLLVWVFFGSCSWILAAETDRQTLKTVDDRIYVVIMLEYETWPGTVEEQMQLVQKLQEQALLGPLSEGFSLVHKFATVPAVSGWITSTAFVSAEKNSLLKDGNKLIRAIDPDVSGGVYEEDIEQRDNGGGGLASSIPLIAADKIHELGITGKGIEVAILDSGVDSDHPDLQSALLAEQCFCFNPGGGCCPNGSASQTGAGSAEDDHGHGTHVSGIIASRGNISAKGVAPGSGITMVKMLDSNNSFYSSSDIVRALDWLNINRPGLDVVNMSLYTNATFSETCDSTYAWTQALYRAVANLTAKNVVVVAIAGNNGEAQIVTAPGCLSNVISVGATDSDDTVARFSNSHTSVKYFAPGVNIVSDAIGGGTKSMSGTSMAAPHVAGAAALIRQASPGVSNAQMMQALSNNGVDITDWNGLTRPRIQIYDALCSLVNCSTLGEDSPEKYMSPATLHLLLNDQ
ncbi:S8 family peptidase [Desulfogranum japonicum]|uniref:S8 family peptidase n=1 Tax=Desulfogranum japonicum TaxID=231447 RepID=UPI0004111C27|nr:S8 family serine peptidase [Desulfogranum japonicum]